MGQMMDAAISGRPKRNISRQDAKSNKTKTWVGRCSPRDDARRQFGEHAFSWIPTFGSGDQTCRVDQTS